ncbi:hypothetical protein EON77_06380 [bacterium]|nr:MAG: hypothetical protein EON77_06380 [bacterium]
MKPLALLGPLALIALAGTARAQGPDLRFKIDLALQLVSEKGGPYTARLYTPFGRYSTVAITALTEPGFNVTVSQRVQRFDNDVDDETLDEYFVEDPGIWRVGKQYLPFGSQSLLRESVRAVRADTDLILEAIPVSFAAFDGGPGRARGAMGRVGPRAYGVSFAAGRGIGASGSALAFLRSPEGSPGPGGGWARAFGFDAAYRVAYGIIRFEALGLRGGELRNGRDADRTVVDLNFTRELRGRDYVQVGLTNDFDRHQTFLRATANLRAAPNVVYEPFLLLRDGSLHRVGIGARVRF